MEIVHGHQAQAVVESFDLATYPGSAVGGLVDHVYATGRQFSVLANSDFHVHKHAKGEYDYPLGVFNHTLVGVRGDRGDEPAAIFEALRAGRTCASQGHWLRFGDFSIRGGSRGAAIGDKWQSDGGDALLRIRFRSSRDDPRRRRNRTTLGRFTGLHPALVRWSTGWPVRARAGHPGSCQRLLAPAGRFRQYRAAGHPVRSFPKRS